MPVNVRFQQLPRDETARLLKAEWDRKWSSERKARWSDRSPPVEVSEAVESGWIPKTGRMIDLGCGTAEIAAWFAERGYQATGVDIARAALDRAAAKHGELSASMEFIAVDLSTQTLPGRSFEILVDRGCLHQIPGKLIGDYIRNLWAIAAPGAKLLLFMKAFRDGRPFGDPEEARQHTEWTRRKFDGCFDLEQARPTALNPDNSEDPMPGMAFWLSRLERPSA